MKVLSVLARFLRPMVSAARAGGGARKLTQARSWQQFPVPQAPQVQGWSAARDGAEPAVAKSFPADPSLPQLEVAKDPELMREVFQRHLRTLGKEAYHVRECQLSFVRYRQGKRCMLEYALHLEEPSTGRERSQWVTGIIDAKKGRTRRLWEEELRRSEPVRGVDPSTTSRTFAPFSYVAELEMLVQVFPYDRQLPALPLLLVGPPPELEPSLLVRFGPGDWQVEAWDVEVVRYVALTRAILRLTVRVRDATTGRVEERRFYAKVYRNQEQGEQTYQVLRALWEKAEAGGGGFTVGRPVTYLSDLRTLVQEEILGTPLLDILLREAEATPVVRKVAKTLAALHLDHMVVPRRRTLRDEVAELKGRGKLLQSACPHLSSEVEETVDAIVSRLEEAPPAPTHCDLSPVHIMLEGDRLALLDLDDFAEADPVLDVALLLAYLANAPLYSSLSYDRGWKAAQTFVEEYFIHVPAAWRARLPLHYAGVVLKIAVGLFRYQKPGWAEDVEALLKEAKDSLVGKGW